MPIAYREQLQILEKARAKLEQERAANPNSRYVYVIIGLTYNKCLIFLKQA